MTNQPIDVRYLEGNEKPDRWALLQPIGFDTPAGPVVVPAGFITDFASTPVWLWGVFPPINRCNRRFILHDYWYDNRLFEDQFGEAIARKMADESLLSGLNEIEPDKKVRNYCMFLACRWFGRAWWIN